MWKCCVFFFFLNFMRSFLKTIFYIKKVISIKIIIININIIIIIIIIINK